ncbi:N-formyl peptide receptor 3-like [Actinia tenebrosa]|uniref:N-formyl peptide receptor 3-like n=1 Tax=Actinia tenebrosa TaxID=6105 RepID=A0A6P8IUL6_ACTTE|nr:N-formyl peptide receptor 3-like [Actinia tenebrosa]
MVDIRDIALNSTANSTNGTECFPYRNSPSEVEEPKASENFRTVFMAFIIFFSIVGNALVLRGAISRRNKPFVYYLVINLSIAEISIGVLRPFDMVVERTPFKWVFGDLLCQLVKPLSLCAAMVVTFTLAAIAVFRAIMMLQPKRNRPTKRFAFKIMAFSWIWGACLLTPIGLNQKLYVYPDPCAPVVLKICSIVEDMPVYDVVYYIAFFFAPFALMLASYSIVIYRIKQHIRSEETSSREESIDMTSVTCTRASSLESETRPAQFLATKPPQSSPYNQASQLKDLKQRPRIMPKNRDSQKSKMLKFEKDVLNILYILILVFFICYLPWTIMYILLQIARVPSAINWPYKIIFDWYMTLLHSLPSALHPICYGAASKVININFRFPCKRSCEN